MSKNIFKSTGAVLVGLIVISVLAAITDVVLQKIGILSVPQETKFTTAQALLALFYHVGSVVLGSYLTARLAPNRPMAHALALGVVGIIMSILGLIAIISGDLAPMWYGWALIVLSLPVAWIGGKLFILQQKQKTIRP
jgi:hypothetical protein